MTLVEFNWNPTNRQLKQFGLSALIALPLLGWVWGAAPTLLGGLGMLGVVIAFIALIAPSFIKPVFITLALVATPIGMVIGELAMFLIYLIAFLPISLCFRVTGRDALLLHIDRKAETYWSTKKRAATAMSYYRQS